MSVFYRIIVLLLISLSLIAFCDARKRCVRHRNRTKTNRIVGGETAKDDEFMDYVGLHIPNAELEGHWNFCGGVLLQPDLILTAFHCVKRLFDNPPPGKFIHALQSKFAPDVWSYDDRKLALCVAAMCRPQYYTEVAYKRFFDVGVLRLEKPFEDYHLTKLATKQVEIGESTVAIGHGLTHLDKDDNYNIFATKLQKIAMERAECYEFEGGDTQVCFTSKEGGDVCYGDSGSPVYNENNEVVALTSYGIPGENCIDGFKARSVFSDVVDLRPIIDQLVIDCLDVKIPKLPPRDELL